MRKLAPLALVLVSASTASAGPGACVQTLIAIQQAAHGSWLKGVVPALIRGTKGHNDVVLVQRKDGSLIVNEGAKFYSLPLQRPLGAKGSLLSSAVGSSTTGRKHSFLSTEAARIVTLQGNEVDLHIFTSEKAQATILRGRNDDAAILDSAVDTAQRGGAAADRLVEEKTKELEICEDEKESALSSLTGSVSDIVRSPGQPTNAEIESAKKSSLRSSIEDFKGQKVAAQAQLAELEKVRTQVATNDKAIDKAKLTLTNLPDADVEGVLSEVSSSFSEIMAETEISDTDRAEILKECGDGIKLPERKATATEKLKSGLCDGMPGPQKSICQMIMKGQ